MDQDDIDERDAYMREAFAQYHKREAEQLEARRIHLEQLRTSLDNTDVVTVSLTGDEAMVQKVIRNSADHPDPSKRLSIFNWGMAAAARAGFSRIVRLFMDNGASADTVPPDEYCTALCEACAYGREEVVKVFIEYGAPLKSNYGPNLRKPVCDRSRWHIFEAAAKGDHASIPCHIINIIEMIMNRQLALGLLDHQTAFDAATSARSMATIRMLTESSMEIPFDSLNYDFALQAAIGAEHRETASFMIEGDEVYDRVRGHISRRMRSQMTTAVTTHVDAYDSAQYYETILAASIRPRNENIVEKLIQHGANYPVQGLWLYSAALKRAASFGEEQMVRMLISGESDVKSCQFAYARALFFAVQHNHPGIVGLLTQNAIRLGLKVASYKDRDSCTALVHACRQGQIEDVQNLIATGALLEYRLTANKDALSEAIWRDQSDIVKILVENGAAVDEENNRHKFVALHNAANPHRLVVTGTSRAVYIDDSEGISSNESQEAPNREIFHDSGNELHLAIVLGNAEIVRMLIESGVNVNGRTTGQESPLHLAAKIGYLDILKILIANSADLGAIAGHQGTAFDIAAAYHHQEVFEVLAEHRISTLNHEDTILNGIMYLAAAMGYEKVVESLIKHGVNMDAQVGWHGSSLQNAIAHGNKPIVDLLLGSGASPNILGGHNGTALQTAAVHSNGSVVLALLEKGAMVNATGGQFETALRAAVEAGSEEVVAILVANGADVNTVQSDFSTALIAASAKGYIDIVKILLKNGADVNARGGWYGNALETALAYGHEQVVDILLEFGAEPI